MNILLGLWSQNFVLSIFLVANSRGGKSLYWCSIVFRGLDTHLPSQCHMDSSTSIHPTAAAVFAGRQRKRDARRHAHTGRVGLVGVETLVRGSA